MSALCGSIPLLFNTKETTKTALDRGSRPDRPRYHADMLYCATVTGLGHAMPHALTQ